MPKIDSQKIKLPQELEDFILFSCWEKCAGLWEKVSQAQEGQGLAKGQLPSYAQPRSLGHFREPGSALQDGWDRALPGPCCGKEALPESPMPPGPGETNSLCPHAWDPLHKLEEKGCLLSSGEGSPSGSSPPQGL